MLALRIMQGIAKPLAEHVLDLKHSPLSKQAMKAAKNKGNQP